MSEPEIAGTKPRLVALEAGKTYSWCACGRSKSQPFCDGSHIGTTMKPLRFTAPETREALLCVCKRTGKQPFCDGAHNSLNAEYAQAGSDEIAASASILPTPRTGDGNAKSHLDGGCYVATPTAHAMSRRGVASFSQVIGARDGAKFLSQFLFEVGSGATDHFEFRESDVVIFVATGDPTIEIGGRKFKAPAHSGVHVRPGETIRIINEGAAIVRLLVTVCPQADAPEWRDGASDNFDADFPARVFDTDPAKREPMAGRFYQVLVGDETGSKEVTQFVGEIPRSRAAAHHHLYEEAIMILSGEGYMWTENARAFVAPGDIIFLPRKQIHSLECVSDGGMRLMGAFYPAGSPAINY